MPQYKQGDIVLARVRDPDGRRISWSHPVIILNKTKDISPEIPVSVMVITTKFRRPLETGQLLMPWSADGHKETGLWRECIAQCDWIWSIDYSTIVKRLGFTPPTILEQIAVEIAHQIKKRRDENETT